LDRCARATTPIHIHADFDKKQDLGGFVFKRVCRVYAAAVSLLLAEAAFGQSTLGNIVGVVQDQSQAVVAGAAIKLRNLEDNSQRATLSVNDGSFQFPNLKAGTYALTIQREGFSEFTLASVFVDARQTARVEATLQVASAGASIEVNEAAAVVNTENGTLADTKKFNQVVQLPMNYRGGNDSPLAALVAVPGVQQDSNGNISIGGGTPSQIQYSVDGASTVNVRNNGALGNMNPSSELISEFKVAQFNNNAEFSQAGDVTIITKSGSNQFHGSAFEYMQNSGFDATTYGFDSKAHKAHNTFGGSFSGPVMIPHIYQGKDKTFFFVDYEANRRRFATPQQFSVPTAAMRNGNLNGLPGDTSIDPLNGSPFPGNVLPANRLNSTAQSLFANYLPLPNFSNGSDTNANYRRLEPTPANLNGYDLRIDQTITSKQQIFGRWSWKNVDTTVANAILPSERDHETNRNLIVSHNYTIRPNLLNEVRFAITHYAIQVGFPISGAAAVSKLGLTGLDLNDVPNVNAFPGFNFGDGTGFTAFGRDKTGVTRSQTTQIADNLSWIKGKHTMKFGGDFRKVYYYDLESFGGSDDFGQFTFSAGTFSGNALTDLLLGLPAKSYIAQSGPDVRARAFQTGVYAQDEWHAARNLTVNFGLRWQALQPFVSEIGNLTAFDVRNGGVIVPDNATLRAGFLNSINACPGVNPALPCAPVTRASRLGLGGGVRYFYAGNYEPRISVAWRPFADNKTVVRAGFGIFTMTNLGQLSFNTTNIAVAVVRTTANGLSPTGQPLFQFPNVSTPADPLTTAGTADFYQNVNIHFRDPQSAQWNVTLERQLSSDLTLRLSYVGMNSYRMAQTEDLNQHPASTQPDVFNTRPYRNWGRILSSENHGFANYQALQSELNKSFGHGILFQASHVWAKNISNVAGDAPTTFSPEVIYGTPVADRFHLALNRGNVAGTRRNRVLISAIYQLPVGKGRTFGKKISPIGNAILGGWEVSTVTLWQTGPYLTPITSPSFDSANLNLVYRGAALRPDRIGSGAPAHATLDQYFDINAFNPAPAPGRIGNSGIGILEGPGTTAIAVGMSKTFNMREGMRLRFEATFTNLPNHPNFAPPAVDVSSAATFGKITTVQSAENSGNRTGQLALRLDF
jgi:hypothetical protein